MVFADRPYGPSGQAGGRRTLVGSAILRQAQDEEKQPVYTLALMLSLSKHEKEKELKPFQKTDQSLHVGRRRGFKVQGFFADRMGEAQNGGVQGLTAKVL